MKKKGKLNQIPLRHKLSSTKGKIPHLLALSSKAYGLGRKNLSLYLDKALLVHVREGRREERGKKGSLVEVFKKIRLGNNPNILLCYLCVRKLS